MQCPLVIALYGFEDELLIGLFFLATVAIWLFACIWLSIKIGNLVADLKWKQPIKFLTLMVLLSSSFVDEVIGKYQFEVLCKANGIESADVSRARGKKVQVEYGSRKLVQGTILPIHETSVIFANVDSGEILIHYKIYDADGGWRMAYATHMVKHGVQSPNAIS